MISRKSDRNDVPATRFVKAVSEAVDEVDASLFVGGIHADALDANGQKHDREDDQGRGGEDKDPDERDARISPDHHALQPVGLDCGRHFLLSIHNGAPR